jgi:hypothetical protein
VPVGIAAQAGEEVDDLAARQLGPQVDVARHVRQAAVELDGVAPGIAAQQGELAGVGAEQAEQDPDRGRLAGAVRSEEAVDRARRDVEVQAVEGSGGAEPLDQPGDRDHVGHVQKHYRTFRSL